MKDATLREKSIPIRMRILQVIVWLLALYYLLGILIGGNLFMELPLASRMVLIGGFCRFGFIGKPSKEEVPFEIEIRFYDDYFVMYKPYVNYNKNLSLKEIYTIKYSDVKRIVYGENKFELTIFGDIYVEIYIISPNGEAKLRINELRKDDDCFVYCRHEPNLNFLDEIEKHSPLMIERKEF